MAKMTGARLFAEVMHGYGVTHVFHVPTILMRALAEMDEFKIHKIMTHGEKAAAICAQVFDDFQRRDRPLRNGLPCAFQRRYQRIWMVVTRHALPHENQRTEKGQRQHGGGSDGPLGSAAPAGQSPHPLQQGQGDAGQGAVLQAAAAIGHD